MLPLRYYHTPAATATSEDCDRHLMTVIWTYNHIVEEGLQSHTKCYNQAAQP